MTENELNQKFFFTKYLKRLGSETKLMQIRRSTEEEEIANDTPFIVRSEWRMDEFMFN